MIKTILAIIGDLSHYNVNASVIDKTVTEQTGFHSLEVNRCLYELESCRLIKRQTNGLLNITKEGLRYLNDKYL